MRRGSFGALAGAAGALVIACQGSGTSTPSTTATGSRLVSYWRDDAADVTLADPRIVTWTRVVRSGSLPVQDDLVDGASASVAFDLAAPPQRTTALRVVRSGIPALLEDMGPAGTYEQGASLTQRATLTLHGTSVVVPPGILETGKVYVAAITSGTEPGWDVSAPARWTLPREMVPSFTAAFSP